MILLKTTYFLLLSVLVFPTSCYSMKLIPSTYDIGADTRVMVEGITDAFKKGTATLSDAMNVSTENISQGLVDSTTKISEAVGVSTKRMCNSLERTSAVFAETAQKITETAQHTSLDLIESMGEFNATAKKIATETNQTFKELNTTLQPLTKDGVLRVGIDPRTAESLDKATAALIPIAQNGIQTKFSIDPITIKTAMIGGFGFTLATLSAVLIYKELTKTEVIIQETTNPKPITWSKTFKNVLKNRYLIGTAGIISGLVLMAKSNSIAAYI